MAPVRAEIRSLALLAGPAIATQFGTMLMGVVDTIMLGRFSTEALGAAAIGNVWTSIVMFAATGVLMGLDPIVSQAHGAGEGERAGRALQHGLVIGALLSLPVAGLFLATETTLLAIGQDPALAAGAQVYLWVQIPSIPCIYAYTALRQYLQGRTIVRPAMWVMIVANVVNAAANWVLIYGNLGFPALGLVGAGIATTLVRAFLAGGLLGLIVVGRLHHGAWTPWSRAALDWRALARLAALGIPVYLQLLLEIGAFAGSTLLAGYFGVTALAGHSITLNLASLAFMVPLGVSFAASTRIGNLIGARERAAVHRSAAVALVMGVGATGVAACAFIWLPEALAALYTPDAAVIAVCALLLPIAGAFQIFDAAQVVATGALRGMGRTRPAAWANFVGYWVIGLPGGAWLAFRTEAGIAGLWWGLALGLAIVATALVLRTLLGPVPEALAAEPPRFEPGRGPGRVPGTRPARAAPAPPRPPRAR